MMSSILAFFTNPKLEIDNIRDEIITNFITNLFQLKVGS